mmetsp:Transcript_57954/g.172954  ORF Transcript_57954/g.172954 Transcript_57954/m.172954 type:complete len:269 (-) Transcript_57954:78-884(-)
MGNLEGLKHTEELRSILKKVLLVSETLTEAEIEDFQFPGKKSRRSDALAPQPLSHAKEVLANLDGIALGGVIPLSSLKAMRSVIISSRKPGEEDASSLLEELEKAVSRSSLVYSAPPSTNEESEERKKYLRRMDRLRLRAEESKYKKLTQNLDNTVADDVTMKSMSYAASVGLNMIVAPISFGVFMYFFAGALFGWVLGEQGDTRPGQTDIKSVITGVVSGVLMLFIEMTLFVIRSHEMDASVRKKAKTSRVNPFGYNKQRAQKTFTG